MYRNHFQTNLKKPQLSIIGIALLVIAWQIGGGNVRGQENELEPPTVEAPATKTPAAVTQAPTASELAKLRNRETRARRDLTIFSPLDLPTPTSIRTAIGLPGPDYWQQQVDYAIQVELDAEKDSLKAKATITYTNNSPTPLPYLWMSLEQNLFRNDSDGAKFTPPGSRFNNTDTGFEGGYKIGNVSVSGKEVAFSVFDTVARVDLSKPVEPNGGQVVLDIEWSFNIPEYGADRMGIRHCEKGKIYQLAQWFPSICKFDDVHGWNSLPYLGQGEFYTDFGSYDVQITAPRSHVVCATGVLQNESAVMTASQMERLKSAKSSSKTVVIREQSEIGNAEFQVAGDGPLTWHFKADKVRTFGWTSSDATIWDAAGIKWDDGSTVLVQSVYPEEATSAWVESTQMLRLSILTYSEQWFRYPYPTATNVNGVCAGMEYPMIIFCGSDTNKRGLHSVTSHEIGHTWFPMVVNTDERRHPWMDEGFNTFINAYDRWDTYVAIASGKTPPERSAGPPTGRGRGNTSLASQPVELPADQIRPNLLGRLAYGKPGAGMRMLREVIVGTERFDAAFKLYIKEWAFKSPQPADFFRCMENGTGMNLAWYWRGWFLEDTLFDQAIANVRTTGNSPQVRVDIANKQEMVMPVFLKVDFADGSSRNVELPVYVWYYTNLWTTDIPTDGKTVTQISLDPNRNLPDCDRDNNVWKAPPETEKPADTNGS